jgi:hypothetical protein
VPIIAKADVEPKRRQRCWLERLWRALQDDEKPYLELLGDSSSFWGEFNS